MKTMPCTRVRFLMALACGLLGHGVVAAASSSSSSHDVRDLLQGATPWKSAQDYPVPHLDPVACRLVDDDKNDSSSSWRACDPDGVFAPSDWRALDQFLAQTDPVLRGACGEASDPVSVQMAVAVTRKLDLQAYRGYEDPQSRAAADFAQKVHNHWGVGVPTACGGTGVLLLLSDLDRVVYLSRGDALRAVLTDARLDRVVAHMKPSLQRQQYREAVVLAVQEMVYLIHSGPPGWVERTTDFVTQYSGMLGIAAIFGLLFWNARHQRAQQRQYAAAAAHLTQLERARAEALQGHFQMDSCPICLEAFPKPAATATEPKEDDTDTDTNNDDQNSSRTSSTRPTHGSDGQPLKLLRCGHCFDESCWAEWVNTGRGQIDKCPVCQQDVGRTSDEQNFRDRNLEWQSATTSSATGESTNETPPGDRDEARTTEDTDPLLQVDNAQSSMIQQQDDVAQVRALQRYQRERNFRLARLAVRYPRFITQQHLQRWTSSTYDGSSMVRDPAFVRNDPSLDHGTHSTNSNSNSNSRSSSSGGSMRMSTFGGGTSGGGRGGRW